MARPGFPQTLKEFRERLSQDDARDKGRSKSGRALRIHPLGSPAEGHVKAQAIKCARKFLDANVSLVQ
jgi:hypothetical protein